MSPSVHRASRLEPRLQVSREQALALRERVQQVLGPSLLAVAAIVGRESGVADGLFRRAAGAQGPLLDAERLTASAFGELLIAAEAPTTGQVRLARAAYERTRDQLEVLVPRLPAGLRPELGRAVADLGDQLGPTGVFDLRLGELAIGDDADRLVTASRVIAARLKISTWIIASAPP